MLSFFLPYWNNKALDNFANRLNKTKTCRKINISEFLTPENFPVTYGPKRKDDKRGDARHLIHIIPFHFISFHSISSLIHFIPSIHNLISFYFIWSHCISFSFISFPSIPFHFISFSCIPFHLTQFHFISFHFTSFHLISSNSIQFHFIWMHILVTLKWDHVCEVTLYSLERQR